MKKVLLLLIRMRKPLLVRCLVLTKMFWNAIVFPYRRKEYYDGDNYNHDYVIDGIIKTNATGVSLMPYKLGVSLSYIIHWHTRHMCRGVAHTATHKGMDAWAAHLQQAANTITTKPQTIWSTRSTTLSDGLPWYAWQSWWQWQTSARSRHSQTVWTWP